jgi:hypothetical protein
MKIECADSCFKTSFITTKSLDPLNSSFKIFFSFSSLYIVVFEIQSFLCFIFFEIKKNQWQFLYASLTAHWIALYLVGSSNNLELCLYFFSSSLAECWAYNMFFWINQSVKIWRNWFRIFPSISEIGSSVRVKWKKTGIPVILTDII